MGFQCFNYVCVLFSGCGLIFNVGIDVIEQMFCVEFGQFVVEIFVGLVEKFIRGIVEIKDGECGFVQFWCFFREQEFM